ncbi:cytochrome c [Vibrio lamellibrachiae]|uniref:c-type cytochrome n=1 Tax=Vibrio lamellibrachiae TaxID=2910253 RepID=UPI003D0B0284
MPTTLSVFFHIKSTDSRLLLIKLNNAGLPLKTLILSLAIIFTTPFVLANESNGEKNYQSLCATCHGDLGHGGGLAASSLAEAPSNIYSGLTSWFETENELIDTVLNGNEGMPAWGAVLSEEEVKEIFSYIRKINK